MVARIGIVAGGLRGVRLVGSRGACDLMLLRGVFDVVPGVSIQAGGLRSVRLVGACRALGFASGCGGVDVVAPSASRQLLSP